MFPSFTKIRLWIMNCFAMVLILTAETCSTDDGPRECEPITEQRCGSNVGICRAGWQQCDDQGFWGPCMGAIEASEEICDGLDNDCNGETDELSRPCVNACNKKGLEHCLNGEWICDVVTPLEECDNNIDDDCDGATDEACNCLDDRERPCGLNLGECKPGIQYCKDGIWTECFGDIAPQTESCDSLDNDCDGLTDDEITNTCYNSCWESFEQICENGSWICTAKDPLEICNDNLDNDCDGYTDESDAEVDCHCENGTKSKCWTDVGECEFGEATCVDGGWSECVGGKGPEPEICDGLDNDCDGWTDDISRSCDQADSCHPGYQTCANGKWGDCVAQGPSEEVCNCMDDDCDGKTDEELPVTDCSTSCGPGKQRCVNCWMQCDAPQPQSETCDGKDNDCDNSIDEDLTRGCTVKCPSEGGGSRDGTEVCRNGRWENCVADVPCPH